MALALAGTAVVVAVVLAHRDEAVGALAAAAPPVLLATVLLHVAVLVVRAEIWGATVAAIDGRSLPRTTLHGAAQRRLQAGVLSSHLTLPTRIAVVRRRAPDDAPRAAQLVLDRRAALGRRGGVRGRCCCRWRRRACRRGRSRSRCWRSPRRWSACGSHPRRIAETRLAAGLAVRADRRARVRVAALGLVVVALTLLRLLLILWACGMDHGPAAVALTYIASSVLGVLPIGRGDQPRRHRDRGGRRHRAGDRRRRGDQRQLGRGGGALPGRGLARGQARRSSALPTWASRAVARHDSLAPLRLTTILSSPVHDPVVDFSWYCIVTAPLPRDVTVSILP